MKPATLLLSMLLSLSAMAQNKNYSVSLLNSGTRCRFPLTFIRTGSKIISDPYFDTGLYDTAISLSTMITQYKTTDSVQFIYRIGKYRPKGRHRYFTQKQIDERIEIYNRLKQ